MSYFCLQTPSQLHRVRPLHDHRCSSVCFASVACCLNMYLAATQSRTFSLILPLDGGIPMIRSSCSRWLWGHRLHCGCFCSASDDCGSLDRWCGCTIPLVLTASMFIVLLLTAVHCIWVPMVRSGDLDRSLDELCMMCGFRKSVPTKGSLVSVAEPSPTPLREPGFNLLHAARFHLTHVLQLWREWCFPLSPTAKRVWRHAACLSFF